MVREKVAVEVHPEVQQLLQSAHMFYCGVSQKKITLVEFSYLLWHERDQHALAAEELARKSRQCEPGELFAILSAQVKRGK